MTLLWGPDASFTHIILILPPFFSRLSVKKISTLPFSYPLSPFFQPRSLIRQYRHDTLPYHVILVGSMAPFTHIYRCFLFPFFLPPFLAPSISHSPTDMTRSPFYTTLGVLMPLSPAELLSSPHKGNSPLPSLKGPSGLSPGTHTLRRNGLVVLFRPHFPHTM